MMNAKSFGRVIESREEMEEALSTYIARLGEKLRQQESLAARITVFLHTNGFDTSAEQYSNEFTVELPHATAFTPTLIKHALAALHAIYHKGYRYKRVGVMLGKITPLPGVQLDLFGELSPSEYERQARFMYIVDALNRIMGPGTLTFAIQGTKHRWGMHQAWLSPHYTSRWDELLTIQ